MPWGYKCSGPCQWTRLVTKLINENLGGIFNIVSNERLSKYEFGMRLANSFGLDAGLINEASIDDRMNLVKRPKDISLSNDKICKILDCTMLSIDEQFQALKMEKDHHQEITM
jgi:dTDP-4-dehydrorhamnose reductase